MNVELLDRNQKQLITKKDIDADAIKQILRLVPEGDYTLSVEHENGALMLIAIDKGMYTLFVQVGDNEFYDYICSLDLQGDIEFIQGGQMVEIDRKYLASKDVTMNAIDMFTRNPSFVHNNAHWQLQI